MFGLFLGNTPLHLAVMLGRKGKNCFLNFHGYVNVNIVCNSVLYFKECVNLLIAHGAPIKVKNFDGWSPLAEAISYGDRQTSNLISISIWGVFFFSTLMSRLNYNKICI